ncbi:YhdP family protein [Marinicella sediminis]|uniref:YhdP family protein n=1 Tax=Marinicella sediminis TaxID=1792834 RepID=A0ABV7J7R3_9GAMM|nr:AsmA-like C-terminal region-containing protein [Marinicella sediminis]
MTRHRKHHWTFRLWVKIRGLLALLIVTAGVAVGLLSLLLPFESLYQSQLEDFLEEQWGLQVDVESIDGSWRGYGPYFDLRQLSLTGKQQIDLDAASLSLNVYQMLLPGGRSGIDLSIKKAELGMIHSAEGASITINDASDEARFTDMLDRILTTGSLRVDELTLNLANEQGEVLLAGLQAGFLLEQDPQQRAFKLSIQNDDTPQSIEIRSVGQRSQSLTKDASWYIQINQFEVSQLNELFTGINWPKGQLDGEIWLSAKAGYISRASASLQWHDEESGLHFSVKNKHQGQQKNWVSWWQFSDVQVGEQRLTDFMLMAEREDDISYLVSEGAIPMALLPPLSSLLPVEHPLNNGALQSISGQAEGLQLSIDHIRGTWLDGQLKFSDLNMAGDGFVLTKLAGEISLAEQQLNVLIDSQNGQLQLSNHFRGTAEWQQLSMQISTDPGDPLKQIKINNVFCQCGDFNLQVWADFHVAEAPHLILNSRIFDADVTQLWKYWPHVVWKPKTIDWLDASLQGGQVENGYVFINGKMVSKAFQTGEADFISRAYVKGNTNQFRPDWPAVRELDAIALFKPDEVKVDVLQASTAGINITTADVDIDSIDSGRLKVHLHASSQRNELLDYLQKSPLSGNLELSKSISLGGQQAVELDFAVSIKNEVNIPFQPRGLITFQEGQFTTEHFALTGIDGTVALEGRQLQIKDLPAILQDAPVTLNGSITTGGTSGTEVDVNMSGVMPVSNMLDKVNYELPIKGASAWDIQIKSEGDRLNMLARSDLAGVGSQLPAPLNKTSDEEKWLTIECYLPCEQSVVKVNYDDQIATSLDPQTGRHHLSQLQFVGQNHPADPNQPYGGYIAELDLDQWLELMTAYEVNSEQSGDLPFDQIDLNIGSLTFMSRVFSDMDLQIRRLASSYEIEVSSEAIKGLVIIDDDLPRKGIVAEFDHLNWIDADAQQTEDPETTANRAVPDIHLWARSFSYADIPLGELRMEMRNVADGIKIDQLNIKSELAEINVSGTWNNSEGEPGSSAFNIVMFSERIADFLGVVGFAAPITNAQTLVEMNARWNGAPSQFNMANIDGELDIKLGQGQVLDQEPGFGRVLGLFNLTNLPRRLILDFRDVLADGLMFSSMEGHFSIQAGVASTEDFLIKASSARIYIEGDVGFADQSYAQTITIRPQIGKTFPTIGAIAGGPVGAAAGFLVQGLFDKQLKNSNEIVYRVTGTWDKPQIELISDE